MINVSVKVKRRKSMVQRKAVPLFVQLIGKRKMRRIPLDDLRLYEEEWDPLFENVCIPPGTSRERTEYLLRATDRLEKELSAIRTVISKLANSTDVTVEEIVAAYQERNGSIAWTAYLDKLIEGLREKGCDSTARHYRSLERSFNTFLEDRVIMIRDISDRLIKEYEGFLVGKGLMPNTVSFYLRTFRAVWNKAVRAGLIEQRPSPFREVNTRIEKTEKRAVDTDVIGKLENLRDTLPGNLAMSLDFFLFCYYARGMAFIDLAYLTKKNMHGDMIVYKRRKTGQELQVKILPVMKKLLDRYRDKKSPYLFPILNTGADSDKKYQSALRLQNLHLQKIGKKIGVKLSAHVPRHSWASAAKSKGVPDELISEGMGHTSVKTTWIYIRKFNNTRLDNMNEYVITGKKQPPGSPYEYRGRKQML